MTAFYDALTRYVEDQSIKASEDESARGRALSFTMAMLQRRFASSVYAVRRSLERMRDKRQKILADPEKYRRDQIEDRLPDDFDDLPEDERQEIEARLEGVVASVDPAALRDEIHQLGKLIEQARALEGREVESKLVKLRKVLSDNSPQASGRSVCAQTPPLPSERRRLRDIGAYLLDIFFLRRVRYLGGGRIFGECVIAAAEAIGLKDTSD